MPTETDKPEAEEPEAVSNPSGINCCLVLIVAFLAVICIIMIFSISSCVSSAKEVGVLEDQLSTVQEELIFKQEELKELQGRIVRVVVRYNPTITIYDPVGDSAQEEYIVLEELWLKDATTIGNLIEIEVDLGAYEVNGISHLGNPEFLMEVLFYEVETHSALMEVVDSSGFIDR